MDKVVALAEIKALTAERDALAARVRGQEKALQNCQRIVTKALQREWKGSVPIGVEQLADAYTKQERTINKLESENKRLRQDREQVQSYLQAIDTCARSHPEGYTIVDFQQVWLEQERERNEKQERTIAELRRWIEEEMECRCSWLCIKGTKTYRKSRCNPCKKCRLVATWGGKTSGHPGLETKESERSE